MPEVEAYCMSGKHKVNMKDPVQITMKNGKPAINDVGAFGTDLVRDG